jgi:hypothetical protein
MTFSDFNTIKCPKCLTLFEKVVIKGEKLAKEIA